MLSGKNLSRKVNFIFLSQIITIQFKYLIKDNEIFPVNSVGVVTARDSFVIRF